MEWVWGCLWSHQSAFQNGLKARELLWRDSDLILNHEHGSINIIYQSIFVILTNLGITHKITNRKNFLSFILIIHLDR